MDKEPTLKKAQQQQTILKAIGNYELSAGYRTNFSQSYQNTDINQSGGGYLLGTTFVLGSSTLGGESDLIHTRDVPQIFNFIQFRYQDISINPRFNVYSLNILGQAEGIGATE